MVDTRRVVDVSGRTREGKVSFGSGYLIGPGLVLTAAHVVAGEDGAPLEDLRVRFLDDGRPWACDLAWSGSGGVDAAVLRIVEEGAPTCQPVRWGQLVATKTGITCEAAGFPKAMRQPGGGRDIEHLSGTINTGTGLLGGRVHVTVASASPRDGAWVGMSGAALFCGPLLIGVIVEDPPSFASRRLVVEPVTRLWPEPGFTGVAGQGRAVEAVGLAADSPLPPARSPAFLLRADAHVVRFRSRAGELARLAAWCQGPGFGVRLLTGPGGQGKTRLALELGARLAMAPGPGWVVTWWEAGDPVAALEGLNRPALLVVDYAETRPDTVRELVSAALSESVRAPVRLLLLARGAGDWWGRLSEQSARLEMALHGATVEELAPLEEGLAGRETAFAEALADLSAALCRMGWEHTPPGEVAWPDLRAGRFAAGGAALTLQMAALAGLLGTDRDAGRPVEEVILAHERRYWRRTAEEHRVSLTDRSLRRAVAAAALCGADTEPEALTLLAQIQGLRDRSEDDRIRTALWLRDLYPPARLDARGSAARPAKDAFWGSLQPDRLAEYLISGVVAELPSFLTDLLAATSSEQDHRALTVLSRASVADPGVGAALPGLLAEIPALAAPAVGVAPQSEHPQPLTEALTGLIGSDRLAVEQLAALADMVPQQTRVLAEFAVTLQRRLAALHEQRTHEDPGAYLPDLAMSLNNLSIRLGETGRREEGLEAIQRAVEAYERLAETNPDAYLPALATSLNNLSVDLGEVGRRQEGLTAIQRAVEIRERLAETNPDAYLPDLATSLNNLSVDLGAVGRRQEGLAAIQRAVEIRERLAETNPNAYLPDLATSLNNLSIRLGEAGRRQEGLTAIQRAVEIRERLAETNPDAYLSDLARSILAYGWMLIKIAITDEAIRLIVRGLDIAAERELVDLVNLGASALQDAYRRKPSQTAEAWRRVTSTEPPDWMTQ